MIKNFIIKNVKFVVYVVEDQVMLINSNGVCVLSSDPNAVGERITLPENAYWFKISDDAAMVCEGEKEGEICKVSPFLKNLAELTINQYYESLKLSQNPLDLYLAKILSDSFSSFDPQVLESEGKSLGLNFQTRRAAVVIRFENFEKNLLTASPLSCELDDVITNFKKAIATSIGGFFTHNNEMLTTYLGNDKFAVFKSIANDYEEFTFIKNMKKAHEAIFGPLKSYHKDKIVVGFGNSYLGLTGLVDSFREANLALESGFKFLKTDTNMYYFGDLSELRILGTENNYKKIQYANEIVNKLSNPELKRTLETFFEENLNLTNSALKLGVHPNTVTYRLNKIQEILGLDPRVFDEANIIKIALLTTKLLS